ncbi:MAG: hypothetical protein JXX14_24720, partial [Deltaproteobacteria bacterium]|nr:hypothetical protein [Deltaproteobacteria bacterium]
MTSATKKLHGTKTSNGYAEKRALRRQEAAVQLASRVVHPVPTGFSSAPRKTMPSWLRLWGFGSAALAFHLTVAALLIA